MTTRKWVVCSTGITRLLPASALRHWLFHTSYVEAAIAPATSLAASGLTSYFCSSSLLLCLLRKDPRILSRSAYLGRCHSSPDPGYTSSLSPRSARSCSRSTRLPRNVCSHIYISGSHANFLVDGHLGDTVNLEFHWVFQGNHIDSIALEFLDHCIQC